MIIGPDIINKFKSLLGTPDAVEPNLADSPCVRLYHQCLYLRIDNPALFEPTECQAFYDACSKKASFG